VGCFFKNGFFSTLIIFQSFFAIFPWSHDLEQVTSLSVWFTSQLPGRMFKDALFLFETQHKTCRRCSKRAPAFCQLRASLVTAEFSHSKTNYVSKLEIHGRFHSVLSFVRAAFDSRKLSRVAFAGPLFQSFATTLNLRKSATATKQRTCIIQAPSAQEVSSCLHRLRFSVFVWKCLKKNFWPVTMGERSNIPVLIFWHAFRQWFILMLQITLIILLLSW